MNDNSHIALGYLIGCMELYIKQDIDYPVQRMKETLDYVKENYNNVLSLAEMDLLTQQELS